MYRLWVGATKGLPWFLCLDMHTLNDPVERAFQGAVLVLKFDSLVRQGHRCDVLRIFQQVSWIDNIRYHAGLNRFDDRLTRKRQSLRPGKSFESFTQIGQ